jgi:phage terminase large subunit-like protein
VVADQADVVLAFDGSFSRDCSVLVAATVEPRPHVELVDEFFQNAARMGPATARFNQLVVDGELTHDGTSALARHIANAILREDSRGARLAKEHKDSPRRIDAAVAAVMAVHRAAELAGAHAPSIYL